MEEIVLQLLNDDVAVKGRGFVKLTEAYRKPNSMSDLFKILHTSSNPKVRQYAAVLLKKRLVNAKHWSHIPKAARTDYKAIILKQLINEEVSLRSSLVDLTIIIAEHELMNISADWPELFESIQILLNGESSSDKEIGISLLPAIAANRPETLMCHVELIVCFLTKTLHSLEELNNTLVYNILLTILHLAPVAVDDENIKNVFHETVPQVICSIQALPEFDKDQAIEVLELLDGLCRNVSGVTSLHTAILITTGICIAKNELLDDSLRVKGLEIIKWLVDTKNQTIRDNGLVEPIIDMIYDIICEPVHNELEEFYLNAFTNYDSPMSYALQILDILSQHLPSQELVPQVLQRTESIFEEPDIYVKRGCYLAMAVVVEHCSRFVEKECLNTFLEYVRQNLTNSGFVIRNTVQFTLGRFARYLTIKTSEYAAELLPILWQYLDSSRSEINREKDLPTVDTLFYMLDEFCTTFEEHIVPNLPTLMEYLFNVLESADTSHHIKKLALKSFCRVSDATGDEILSNIPRLIIILKAWVTDNQIEDAADLKAQTFATLGSIGQKIDKTEINPIAAEYFLKTGVRIVKRNSPILKAAVYNYFTETSHVAPTLVAEAVSEVFDDMIRSVQISDRSKLNRLEDVQHEDVLQYQEPYNDSFDLEDNDDDNSATQSEAENSYIEEKKAAIAAFGVLAVTLGETFYPHLETCYREVFKTITYPQTSIRQASLHSLSQFFVAFSKIQAIESKEMMESSADILLPILLGIIYKTNEGSLLEAAVRTYSHILESMKSKVSIGKGHKDATVKCIIDVLSGNTKCQNLKETNTERDDYVKHCAGEMLVNFQGVVSSEESLNVFEQVLPSLLRYTEGGSIPEERSFGIETISQSLGGLGPAVSKFAPQLVPLFVQSIADLDADLRSKSSIAIARIVRYGGDGVHPYYPDIVQALLTALETETDDGTRDNLIGAVGSLIWTNHSILPVEELFPIFAKHLPLKTNTAQYKAVFGGILSLSRSGHTVLEDHVPLLIKIAVNILQRNVLVDRREIEYLATEFILTVPQKYPKIWDCMGAYLSQEEVVFVQQLNFSESEDAGILV